VGGKYRYRQALCVDIRPSLIHGKRQISQLRKNALAMVDAIVGACKLGSRKNVGYR
jgi:hypothetical protein